MSPASYQQRIQELELRLAESETHANALGKELVILQARLSKMDPVTSMLPVELTAYIFQLYVDMHPLQIWFWKGEGMTSFSPVERSAPLRLGAVCQKWRNVAWSLPQLWTTLVTDLTYKGYALGPGLVSEWLGRAGNLPLNICFTNEDADYPGDWDAVNRHGKEVMKVINRHSAQWKCLDFTTLPLDILSELDDSEYTDTTTPSLLDHLAVGGNLVDNDDPPTTRADPAVLQKSRRKHCPRILHLRSYVAPSKINVNWTRIVELRAEHLSRQTILDLIANASLGRKVERLTLDVTDVSSNSLPLSLSEFPSLRCLEITDRAAKQSLHMSLLNSLILPSLDCLRYIYNKYWTTIAELPIDGIVSLTQRSSCTIRHLQLQDCVISNENLIRLLYCLPSLHTLDIQLHDRDHDSTVLLEHLSQTGLKTDTTPFLPLLQSFTVHALPLQSWASLIAIFDDSPSFIANASRPVLERPLRKNLSVSFRLDDPDDTDDDEPGIVAYAMNPLELKKITALWHDYGILCLVRYWRADDESFLWESFKIRFPHYINGDDESDINSVGECRDEEEKEEGEDEQEEEEQDEEEEDDANSGADKSNDFRLYPVDVVRLYADLLALPDDKTERQHGF